MLLMIEKPRPTPAERGFAALRHGATAALTLADAVVMWPFRAAEHRRLLATLAGLSDHDLKDIGLARGDIRDAMGFPLDRDPTHFLAGRRSENRRHR